ESEWLLSLVGPQGDTGSGVDGREIEIQNSGTNIEWRYVGESTWNNVVSIAEITGPKGDTGVGSGEPGGTEEFYDKFLPKGMKHLDERVVTEEAEIIQYQKPVVDKVSFLDSFGFSVMTVPCAAKEGKVYSVLPANGAADWPLERPGTGTYFDKDGIMKTAGPNIPRLT